MLGACKLPGCQGATPAAAAATCSAENSIIRTEIIASTKGSLIEKPERYVREDEESHLW